jgi:predicted MFS family arabinose efflux permease
VFLVNVPIALAALALTGRYVPESRAAAARRLDLGGTLLALGAVAAVVVPLVEGRTASWPAWCFVSFALAPVLALALVAWERRIAARGGTPLLTLELFALRPFRLGVSLSLVFYVGVPGLFLLIALYLQDGLGLSPLDGGLAFLPAAGAFVAASLVGARLSIAARERVLAPAALAEGLGVATIAVLCATTSGGPSALALVVPFLLIGIGNGFVIPGMNGTVLATTAPEQAGSASGLLVTSQQIGGAIGVAIAGTLYFGQGNPVDGLGASTAFFAGLSVASVALAALLTAAARPRILRSARAAGPRARRWLQRAGTR